MKKNRSGGELLPTMFDKTGPGIELQTSRTDCDIFNRFAKRPVKNYGGNNIY